MRHGGHAGLSVCGMPTEKGAAEAAADPFRDTWRSVLAIGNEANAIPRQTSDARRGQSVPSDVIAPLGEMST